MKNLLFSFVFILLSTSIFAQTPANDDVNMATSLEVNPDNVPLKSKSGTLKGSTQTNISAPGCFFFGGALNDVFYTFTAKNKQHIVSLENVIGQNLGPLRIVVYDTTLLNVIKCDDNSTVFVEKLLFLNNLNVNQKYVVQVSGGDYSFDIALLTPPPPPVNDLCGGAIDLTPSNDWTCKNSVTGNTYYSTNDNNNTQQFDVWYSFTATATKHVAYLENIVGITSNNLQIAMEVHDGNCSNSSVIYNTTNPNKSSAVLGGLTIGKKYYVRVLAENQNSFFYFDICILTPVNQILNEKCEQAKVLQVSPTEQIGILETGLTNYNFANNTGIPDEESDAVWYKFVATSDQHIAFLADAKSTTSSNNAYIQANVYEGQCNALSVINSFENNIFLKTVIGKTYYISVFSKIFDDRATFKIGIVTIPKVSNDECSLPIPLTVNPTLKRIFAQNFSFLWAKDSLGNFNNPDVWFSFVAEKTSHTIQTENLKSSSPFEMTLFSGGNCGNFTFQRPLSVVEDTIQTINNLTVGQKYYIKAKAVCERLGCDLEYQIAIGTPPIFLANDEITGAISITPTANCTPTYFNTTWATSSGYDCIAKNNDIWYKFVAQKDKYLLEIDTTIANVTFSFFEKNNNDSLIDVPNGCFLFYNSTNSSQKWLTDLTPNKTYYIKVGATAKTDFNFCLRNLNAISNDEYSNAIALTPNPNETCTQKISAIFENASPTFTNSSFCSTTLGSDIWYKFVATGTQHKVILNYPNSSIDANLLVTFYKYDSLSQVMIDETCFSQNINSAPTLVGKTYYVKISTQETNTAKTNFNICLQTIPQPIPSPNDDCVNAFTLTVGNIGVCNPSTETFVNATISPEAGNCSLGYPEVWFKFVATDTLLALNATSSSNFRIGFYEGTNCSNLQNIFCMDKTAFFLPNLVIGKTYFIAFISLSGQKHNYTICLRKVNTTKPVNDICANAINIPISTGSVLNQTIAGNNHFAETEQVNGINDLCTVNNPNSKYADVWYKFTATKKSHFLHFLDKKRIYTAIGLAFANVEVYAGNCNSGFTAVNCEAKFWIKEEDIALRDLTIGETYYVRVYQYDTGDFSTFKIAVSEGVDAPTSCADASLVQYQTTYYTNTLVPLSTFEWQPNQPSQACRRWYKFKAKSPNSALNISKLKDLYVGSPFSDGIKVFITQNPCVSVPPTILHFEDNVVPNEGKNIFLTGLKTDSIYHITFSGQKELPYAFQFFLEVGQAPAANDSCQGAKTLPINPSLAAVNFVKDSVDSRFGLNKKYYKFTATGRHHLLFLKKYGNAEMQSFYSDCNKIKTTFKGNNDTTIYLYDLTIGKTYFLDIYNSNSLASKEYYDVAILTIPAPVTNDDCSGAINLDAYVTNNLSCTSTHINVKKASPDTIFNTGLSYLWYTFTPKSKNHIFKIDNFTGNNPYSYYLDLQILKGNTCGQPQFVKNLQLDKSVLNNYAFELNNLSVGENYYLAFAVGEWNSEAEFDFCIHGTPPPPANDLCENATPLTPIVGDVPNNLTNGTLKNAYIEKQNPLSQPSARDVWYSFVATAEYHQLYLEKNDLFSFYLTAEMRDKSCDTTSSTLDLWVWQKRNSLTNLTVGKKYWIGVKTNNYLDTTHLDFKIAILTPTLFSQNNTCAKTTTLNVSPTATVTQYSQGNLQYNQELWYKFTATAKSHKVKMLLDNPNNPPLVTGYFEKRIDCTTPDTTAQGMATSVSLNYLLDTLSNQNILGGLTIGTTYYLKVLHGNAFFDDTSLPFRIGIVTVISPENENCFFAKNIPINSTKILTNTLSEDTKGIKISATPFSSEANANLWYSFTATSKRHQLLLKDLTTENGFSASIYFILYDEKGCTSGASQLNSGSFTSFNGDNDSPFLNNLTIGKKYYVYFFISKSKPSFSNNQILNADMTYKIGLITLPDSPSNDDCANAKIAVVNTSPLCQQVTKGSTFEATKDISNFCNPSGADDNVWFKFTATAEQHFIQLKNIQAILGDVIDMEYALYEDNPCTSAQPIGCSIYKPNPFAPWNTEIGKTYYVEVYTHYLNTFSQCEFDLCISTPIANDDVKGAIFVQNTGNIAGTGAGFKSACANPVTASSIGATYSFDAGVPVGACNIGALPKDIWFKTVVGAKRDLAIQVLQSPVGASVQMVAYKLKNGVLTLLPSRCPADTLLNLTQGDTIALRVWDANGTAFGDYTLCIEAFGKTTTTKNTVCTPVTIHPIPTSDYLNFGIAYITEPTFNITISNMSGAAVLQQTVNKASTYNDSYTIDVRSLPTGTYVLSVSDGKKLFTKKFLKI